MKSSRSVRVPIRFWMPWRLACQAIGFSAGGGEVWDWDVDVGEWEGWVEIMMDLMMERRIVCGIRRIRQGK
jgi:hypothetical protein